MSFIGAIDSENHIAAWSRSITSLAALSDTIRFQINPSSIGLSAITSTRICTAEVAFPLTKFHEFSANLKQNERAYNFLVNSRPLSILFKHLDPTDLQYVCFKVMWLDYCPPQLNHKLLIEVKTKKLIVKKYQTSYQNIEQFDHHDNLNLQFLGLQNLMALNSTQFSQFNSMNLEWNILKQFLDVIPMGTEDFKINRDHQKLVFSGYTRQIVRERELLKQPMFVSISLSIDEINECKLNQEMELVNFGIREFKIFTLLVSSLVETKSDASNRRVQVLFSSPGEGIWFVYETEVCKLLYYLITGGDGATINGNGVRLLEPYKVQEASEEGSRRSEEGSSRSNEETRRSKKESRKQSAMRERGVLDLQQSKRARINVLTSNQVQADTDLGESTEDEEEGEEEEEDFGPTQGVSIPRSIFDEGDNGGL